MTDDRTTLQHEVTNRSKLEYCRLLRFYFCCAEIIIVGIVRDKFDLQNFRAI